MGILQDIKNYAYHCPHCRAELNRELGIEFKAQGEDQQPYFVHLDPVVGKYTYAYDYSKFFRKGEKTDFFCGNCENSLQSPRHADYVEIIMVVSEYVEFEILFSRIFGLKKTYLIDENYIESFGVDSVENEISLLELG